MRPGLGRRTRLVPAQAGITRRWAKRGTRPSAPKDQRTASAYIFGAICPAEGKGAGLVLPRCTTEGLTLHLNEIAQVVAPGAHALVLVDQAGWHQSKRLVVPANITLMPLPAKAPELNPVENIWQTVCSLLKRRWLVPHYAAHEGCAGWAGAEPHASGTSHAAGERSFCRSRHFQDEDLGRPGRRGAPRRGALPGRHRPYARGGAATGHQARRQVRPAAVLLRGRTDRLWAAAADLCPRARLRCHCSVADPEAAGRARQDQSPGCPHPGPAASRWRTHPDLGSRPGA